MQGSFSRPAAGLLLALGLSGVALAHEPDKAPPPSGMEL